MPSTTGTSSASAATSTPAPTTPTTSRQQETRVPTARSRTARTSRVATDGDNLSGDGRFTFSKRFNQAGRSLVAEAWGELSSPDQLHEPELEHRPLGRAGWHHDPRPAAVAAPRQSHVHHRPAPGADGTAGRRVGARALRPASGDLGRPDLRRERPRQRHAGSRTPT